MTFDLDLRIGGLNCETNRKLSQEICNLLKDSLGIASDRVYLNFTEVELATGVGAEALLEAKDSDQGGMRASPRSLAGSAWWQIRFDDGLEPVFGSRTPARQG